MPRLVKALALGAVAAVLVPFLTTGTVLAAFLFLPLPATLPAERQGIESQISRVYDIDGNLIGQFRRFEITEPVQPEDIPQVLKDAVIAAEDRRFYAHNGVDIRGTLRALWADIRGGGAVQGGSTITQQYVKNTFVGTERSLSRKIREAVVAAQLDRQMDKDEILFNYLNTVYLGEGAHGVGAAAETYFRKSVRDLTLSEAAMLAGLIPAPSRYEPRGNPAAAEGKRKIVLDAMLDVGLIDQQQHDEALPQQVWFAPEAPPPGIAVTFVHPREQQRLVHPYFMDYVEKYLSARYGEGVVYERGLDIYTTLDPRLQRAAEEEVGRTLEGTAPPLEMALASLEPGSGYVKALVGGRDFYAPGGQNNLALGGSTGRQPGSAFKPFVLAAALEQGISPDKTYSGRSPFCFPGGDPPYCPENYGGSSYGTLNLREATKRSVNTVYVQLIRDVGVQRTMDLAKALGIARSVYREGFHGFSVALGAPESSALDMASAYGVWAARGERAEPTPIVRVLDSEGVVLEDNAEPSRTRVMKDVAADTMNNVLQGVFTPGGTANGRGLDRPAAGKTGTTQDNGDAWFVGYTPQLSTAVWMGRRDDRLPMGRVKGVASVTGGTWPARTWQAFMNRAHEGLPVAEFDKPAPITQVADEAKREARVGFDIGRRQRPSGSGDGGVYQEELPPPEVEPPTSSTTSTTSTTILFDDD